MKHATRNLSGLVTRAALGTMALVGASACSVSGYEKPITQFSTATDNAQAALAGLNKNAVGAFTAVQEDRVLKKELQLRLAAGACLPDSTQCRLELVKYRDKNDLTGEVQGMLPLDLPLQHMMILMSDIQAYAANLADIVKSDAADKVDANVNATVGSLNKLSQTVSGINEQNKKEHSQDGQQKAAAGEKKPQLSDYATPVGSLVSWLAGNYIATVQYDGLKRATRDARPIIQDAEAPFDDAADQTRKILGAFLSASPSEKYDEFKKNISPATLAQFEDSAHTYDLFLAASPSDVFRDMVKAHDTLVANIQGEGKTLAEVNTSVGTFLAQAKKLVEIVKAIDAVGQKKSGSKNEGA